MKLDFINDLREVKLEVLFFEPEKPPVAKAKLFAHGL